MLVEELLEMSPKLPTSLAATLEFGQRTCLKKKKTAVLGFPLYCCAYLAGCLGSASVILASVILQLMDTTPSVVVTRPDVKAPPNTEQCILLVLVSVNDTIN